MDLTSMAPEGGSHGHPLTRWIFTHRGVRWGCPSLILVNHHLRGTYPRFIFSGGVINMGSALFPFKALWIRVVGSRVDPTTSDQGIKAF